MNRKLIIGERLMYVNADTSVNGAFVAKISGLISLDRLRNALNKVQKKHPLLQAKIVEDKAGIPSFTSDGSVPEIPIRIVERLTDHDWETVVSQEWETVFDVRKGPLMRVVWLQSATVSELVMVCAHCICDGATVVSLMREMLAVLDNPDLELVAYQDFNSVQELMPDSLSFPWKDTVKAKILSKLAFLFFLVKATKNKYSPGNHYMLQWTLDKETTNVLNRTCKQENTSVHSALCVAYMEAFKAIKGPEAHGKVICPVDIRRLVPKIKPDMMFAFAPIVELSIEKQSTDDFWAKTRKVQEDLLVKAKAIKGHDMLVMGEYFHASVVKWVDFLKSTPGTHDVTLSNMGRLRIPEHYRSFEVEKIYSPAVAFPWRNPNTLIVSSFRREMHFSFVSNDGFLSAADAQAINKKALDLLLTTSESLVKES